LTCASTALTASLGGSLFFVAIHRWRGRPRERSGRCINYRDACSSSTNSLTDPPKEAIKDSECKAESNSGSEAPNRDGILLDHPTRLVKKTDNALSHHGEAAHDDE